MTRTTPAIVTTPRDAGSTSIAIMVAAVVTGVLATARLITTPRFYYFDDTATGAVGQWWELGDRLMTGTWSILSPQSWQAGNYLAEGQWGLFSPLTTLFALATRLSGDVAVTASVIKIVLLMAMAAGMVLLVRSFEVSAAWSIAAGVAVPLAGFTMYMDAPSWVTGLVNAALLPFAWLGLRRLADGRNPVAFLLPSLLLISAGYIFGVLALAVLILSVIVHHLLLRERATALRVFLAGAIAGLAAIAVYLPGVLTSPVTVRNSFGIGNDGFLNVDLTDLLAAGIPTAATSIEAWWGDYTPAPLQFIAWFLPLIVLTLPIARSTLVELRPAFIMGATMLVIVLGPSAVGPLRFPVRMMPYVAIAAVLIVIVALSRTKLAAVPRAAWIGAAVLIVLGGWSAWTQQPATLVRIGVAVVVQLAALELLRRISTGHIKRLTPFSPPTVAAIVVTAVTVVLMVPQMYWLRTSPLPDFGPDSNVAQLQGELSGATGDTMVIGPTLQQLAEGEDGVLAANLWYFTDYPVQNTYSVIQHLAYAEDLCLDLRGSTCDDAYSTLFSRDAETGALLVDLLSISTLIVLETDDRAGPPAAEPGWELVGAESPWMYVRESPLPAAGGIAWSTPGVETELVSQSETSVTFRLDDDTAADDRVVLSRLAWPGYLVSGARAAESVRDYLVTIDVSDLAAGDLVTVEYRPPAWPAVAGAGLIALVSFVAWSIAAELRRRRPVDRR